MEQGSRSNEQDGTIEPSKVRVGMARRLGKVTDRMLSWTRSEESTTHSGEARSEFAHGLDRPGYIIMPNDLSDAPDVKLSVDEIGKALRESKFRERFDAAMEDMKETAEGDRIAKESR